MSAEGMSLSGSPRRRPKANSPPRAATTTTVTTTPRAFTSRLPRRCGRHGGPGGHAARGAAKGVGGAEHEDRPAHPDPGDERALHRAQHHERRVGPHGAVKAQVEVV